MTLHMHFKKTLITLCLSGIFITPVYASSVFGGDTGASASVSSNHTKIAAELTKQGVLVVQTGNRLKVVLGIDNFFLFPTSTKLVDDRSGTLAKVAELVRGYGSQLITVSGHTDNVGSDEAKLKRSYNQANTIAAYLWSQGIPLRSMMIIGCGDTEPVGSNHAMDGAAANRRIEIEINYPEDLTDSLLGT